MQVKRLVTTESIGTRMAINVDENTHEIATRIGLGVTVGQMFRCSSRSPLLLCVRLVGGQLSLFLGQ